MCHDAEPLIFPRCEPMGVLQGQGTNGEERAPTAPQQPPPTFCAQHEVESKRWKTLRSFSAGRTLVRRWGSCQGWGGSNQGRNFQTAIIKQSQRADFRQISLDHRKQFMNLSCCFSLDWTGSTQTVHGQVSSPTHVHMLLAVMEGDVPSSWISDVQRYKAEKKNVRMTLLILWKVCWDRARHSDFQKLR